MSRDLLHEERGRVLLKIARGALERGLGGGSEGLLPAASWLQEPAASFVSLHRHGALRGCVGTLVAHRPLGEDVASNAMAAAFHDRRFPRLRADELPDLEIEVSVLTPLEPLEVADEAELLAVLRPGVDGLALACGERRATFLPQVWQSLPDPARFVRQLKRKAGLPEDLWSPDLELWRYRVTSWSDREGGR